MAVNDTDLERNPALARLLQAASGEQPSAALDAAILAAARREVSARPQAVGGGGQAAIPPLRPKRTWYVPVSIAAVMVLSVSLVLTMHHEKGDELSQPPVATVPLPKAPAPATAVAESAAAPADKADAMLRDAAPAQPQQAEAKRAEPAQTTDAAAKPELYGELAKKQREDKAKAAVDSAAPLGSSRKDQAAGIAAREQGPASNSATVAKAVSGTAEGGLGAGAPGRERRPEPFPAASEREAPASAPPPAVITPQLSRDTADARMRSEADRNTSITRGTLQEAPAASAALPAASATPQAKVLAAPRRAAPTEDGLPQSTPAQVEGRVMSAPSSAKPAPAPAPKPAVHPTQKPAPVWRGLEDQPPEKWLERLAEFKRDNRPADADELLAEFRRRFPDHPASAR